MQIASWLQSQPLSAFSSLNLVVSHKAEWNKVFWRSCELQLRLTEVSKLSSKVYLKQKVPENWVQTNYHYGYILENNLVISKLNFWPTDVLCFCAHLPRLESEAAHVLGNRRATSHMTVQTTDPPPEAVTFCKSTSMFSRSGAEMSLLLSSTCPIYSSNSMKPDSLPLTPAMLYTMWLNQERLNQACPRLHCCPGINVRGGKAEGKTHTPKWRERCSAGSLAEGDLAASDSYSPCNQLPWHQPAPRSSSSCLPGSGPLQTSAPAGSTHWVCRGWGERKFSP